MIQPLTRLLPAGVAAGAAARRDRRDRDRSGRRRCFGRRSGGGARQRQDARDAGARHDGGMAGCVWALAVSAQPAAAPPTAVHGCRRGGLWRCRPHRHRLDLRPAGSAPPIPPTAPEARRAALARGAIRRTARSRRWPAHSGRCSCRSAVQRGAGDGASATIGALRRVDAVSNVFSDQAAHARVARCRRSCRRARLRPGSGRRASPR